MIDYDELLEDDPDFCCPREEVHFHGEGEVYFETELKWGEVNTPEKLIKALQDGKVKITSIMDLNINFSGHQDNSWNRGID